MVGLTIIAARYASETSSANWGCRGKRERTGWVSLVISSFLTSAAYQSSQLGTIGENARTPVSA